MRNLSWGLNRILEGQNLDPTIHSRAANALLTLAERHDIPSNAIGILSDALKLVLEGQNPDPTIHSRAANAVLTLAERTDIPDIAMTNLTIALRFLSAREYLDPPTLTRTYNAFLRLGEVPEYASFRDIRSAERQRTAQAEISSSEIQLILQQIRPLYKETLENALSEPSFILTFASLLIAKNIFEGGPLPLFLTRDSRIPRTEDPISPEKFGEIHRRMNDITNNLCVKFSLAQRSLLFDAIINDREVYDEEVKTALGQIRAISNEVQRNPILSATLQKFQESVESQ
jgi:hypothetical protein